MIQTIKDISGKTLLSINNPKHDDLDYISLSDRTMMRTDFSGRSMKNANLSYGNFSESVFDKANLTNAILKCSSFCDCYFIGTNLNGAYLLKSDLTNVTFDCVDMVGCNLAGAHIGNTRFLYCTGIVDAGIDNRGYRFIGVKQTFGWRIKAGCRWFTVSEAIRHWTYNNNPDALARVNVIIGNVIPRRKKILGIF